MTLRQLQGESPRVDARGLLSSQTAVRVAWSRGWSRITSREEADQVQKDGDRRHDDESGQPERKPAGVGSRRGEGRGRGRDTSDKTARPPRRGRRNRGMSGRFAYPLLGTWEAGSDRGRRWGEPGRQQLIAAKGPGRALMKTPRGSNVATAGQAGAFITVFSRSHICAVARFRHRRQPARPRPPRESRAREEGSGTAGGGGALPESKTRRCPSCRSCGFRSCLRY